MLKECGKSDLDVLERREWPMVWAMACCAARGGGGCASKLDFGVVMGFQ